MPFGGPAPRGWWWGAGGWGWGLLMVYRRLMSGFFCRQFSIAVWPLVRSPKLSAMQTTSGGRASSLLLASRVGRPKPLRKPLCRCAPTGWPGSRSSIAITGFLPAIAALAYWAIKPPALELSVENKASTTSTGSVGLSSAITITPLARAFLIAGTMAWALFGAIRMVLALAATRFSSAVTWPALSPSALAAVATSLAPSFFASATAPSFIFTKEGLVSVLVIRPITGASAARARAQTKAPDRARAERTTVAGRCSMMVSLILLRGHSCQSGPGRWRAHPCRGDGMAL